MHIDLMQIKCLEVQKILNFYKHFVFYCLKYNLWIKESKWLRFKDDIST